MIPLILDSAIIFVVDSNDRERMAEACEELHGLLSEDKLSQALLLVFANKQVSTFLLCFTS